MSLSRVPRFTAFLLTGLVASLPGAEAAAAGRQHTSPGETEAVRARLEALAPPTGLPDWAQEMDREARMRVSESLLLNGFVPGCAGSAAAARVSLDFQRLTLPSATILAATNPNSEWASLPDDVTVAIGLAQVAADDARRGAEDVLQDGVDDVGTMQQAAHVSLPAARDMASEVFFEHYFVFPVASPQQQLGMWAYFGGMITELAAYYAELVATEEALVCSALSQ